MTAPEIPLPLPVPTPTTQKFWDGTKQHKILLPKTADGQVFFYPRVLAPGTLDEPVEWVEASGKGTVYSFTVDRRGTASAFRAKVPYVIVIVELEEGPRMTSNMVDCAIEDVKIGMPVEAVFEDVSEEITLVKFRPS
ncbi:MAG: Zn-ribbon domain-containing OB-fold protein [Dehalococcoidia bacterium]|nr:Zn-ribbon domain-containing OB-fold protein [Dehalococcoidia bacterium]